jgi:hypothetical protein
MEKNIQSRDDEISRPAVTHKKVGRKPREGQSPGRIVVVVTNKEMVSFLKEQVTKLYFSSPAEYIRELIREKMLQASKFKRSPS